MCIRRLSDLLPGMEKRCAFLNNLEQFVSITLARAIAPIQIHRAEMILR